YIKNLKLYLTRFYGSSYAVFVGRKFRACKIGSMLGFVVVVGGYLKKYLSVLSLCFIVLVGVLFKLALKMSD
ncbi:hypothetical protein BGL87_08440, partial [Helicobacter pylori]|uniref:hypothetical protein n=1 Tax=Helicobacter pylori TaxID=210 RepID=UPI0009A36688